MNSQLLAYTYALCSSICFSTGSIGFADISRRLSSAWMNCFKALLALFAFGAVVFIGGLWVNMPGWACGCLMLSGWLGLGIGDVFLLSAYARMGSARTLILYGFQPLFIGVAAHFFFGQELSWLRLLAIFFFVACLFTFSLERFRESGHWEIYGLVAALLGVLFDNIGILLTRYTFDNVTEMTAFQANFVRCAGALIFFAMIGLAGKVQLLQGWRTLQPRERWVATLSAFFGTFASLCFYLTAVKIGHLASIAALGSAAPILASILESVHLRRPPSRYLIVALILFICGFGVLTVI